MSIAIISFNQDSPTVRQRLDVTKLEEFYTVELTSDFMGIFITNFKNKQLPWLGSHGIIAQQTGSDERFTVIMEK